MKVRINETLEVSDEQRGQIADALDGEVTRRQATREEMKEFIWHHGEGWARCLLGDEDDEDLLGDEDDEDLLG